MRRGNLRSTELSPAESRVAAAVARGLSNREIARELNKSETTVKHQLTQVYRKFGVKRRYHLMALFGPIQSTWESATRHLR